MSVPEMHSANAAQPPSNHPLPTIGGYHLLGELGRGGMGVVYKAEQLALGRIVALKVLTSGAHASPSQLARFRSEAESAARLVHAGIVQVYEVGEADGCPYFSQEFVPGGSLSDKLRGQPQSPAEAARLLVTIARAVQFAHDREIIHRDLKPANVLLTSFGEPKIADFGLAKHLRGASHTRTGEVMGTPSYMAPEQASGVTKTIGPACDVYALGAILYEMLTGRPPFWDQDPVETILQVLSDEPVSIHRLVPRTPRDLETICHKCLEKQPKKRYASVGELADDLERFLNNLPIRARPTLVWERVLKWTRRRPAVASLLAVIFLSVATIISYGFWKNRQLFAALAATETQRQRAEDNFWLALDAAGRRIDRAGEPAEDLLREELQFFEGIRQQTGDDPAIAHERGVAARRIGDIHRMLGELKNSDASYQVSIAELAELARAFPKKLLYRRDLAGAHNGRGLLLVDEKRLADAEQEYGQAQEIFGALIQEAPEDRDYVQQSASVANNQALLAMRQNKPAQAVAHHERTIALRQKLVAYDEENTAYRRDLAISYSNLGALLVRSKSPGEVIPVLESSLRELERLPAKDRAEQKVREVLVSVHASLGFAYSRLDKEELATREHRSAVAASGSLFKDYPGILSYEQRLADTNNNLALLLAAYGHFGEAIEPMESAGVIYRRLQAKHPESQEFKTAAQQIEENLRELKKSANVPDKAPSPPGKGP